MSAHGLQNEYSIRSVDSNSVNMLATELQAVSRGSEMMLDEVLPRPSNQMQKSLRIASESNQKGRTGTFLLTRIHTQPYVPT